MANCRHEFVCEFMTLRFLVHLQGLEVYQLLSDKQLLTGKESYKKSRKDFTVESKLRTMIKSLTILVLTLQPTNYRCCTRFRYGRKTRK